MRRILSALLFAFISVPAQADAIIDYRAFVQVDYQQREKLPGTLTTASAIGKSLQELPGFKVESAIQKDEGPEKLKFFLQNLPDEKRAALSVVYLGGHQSAGGEFEFTDKQKILWSALLEGVEIPRHSRRLFILDACYAEAARLRSDIKAKTGSLLVFSSAAGEKSYELDLGTRRPVDYGSRYAPEVAWLKKNCPPAAEITFLGLMWSRAFLKNPPSSENLADWKSFLEQVQAAGAEFHRDRSDKLSSKIVVVD